LVDDAGDTEAVSVPGAVARVLAGSDGLATTRAEAKDLIAATTAACAREKVRRMLRARERSRQEVAQKLLGEGYPRDVVDLVVEEAVATRILSDTRFAEAFVSSKLRAGWGRVRIERELSTFEKQVLDLHLTGMSYTQIAKVLGRDEKATDNALQRLKSKIRKML